MPGAYTIDPSRRLVLSRGWGTITRDELLQHVTLLGADPRFESSFAQLTDFTAVTDVAFSSAAIHEVAILSPFGQGSRRAMVAPADVMYGLSRMFQILRETRADEVQVFRTIEPALDWLGFADDKAAILTLLHSAPPMPPLA